MVLLDGRMDSRPIKLGVLLGSFHFYQSFQLEEHISIDVRCSNATFFIPAVMVFIFAVHEIALLVAITNV
jgi:hypothetical protein